jgi:hypothetical protein
MRCVRGRPWIQKIDIAVAKAITGHETAAMLSLCAKFKIRNAGALI